MAELNGGLMELKETMYWAEILEESKMMGLQTLDPLKKDTNALIAIFVSLINKWRRK